MNRRHGVSRVEDIPGPELGCQLAKPGCQDRRVLSRKLPRHPKLSQVTVRVLQRHTGLPDIS
jgi:hypothetical protein